MVGLLGSVLLSLAGKTVPEEGSCLVIGCCRCNARLIGPVADRPAYKPRAYSQVTWSGGSPLWCPMRHAMLSTKKGPVISGDIVHIVPVHTNAGYAPNPGHPGTGTIVFDDL